MFRYPLFLIIVAAWHFFAGTGLVRGEDLQEAWRAAVAAHGQILAALDKTEAANWNHIASQRRYRPTLTNKTSYNLLTNGPEFNFLGNVVPIVGDDFVLSTTMARQPLYTGGQISNTVDAASCLASAAYRDADRVLQDVKLQVATGYTEVLRATRRVEVAESNVASLQSHARIVSAMLKTGEVARNDLLAAEVTLADARQRAIRTRNQRSTAEATFNRLLSRPIDTVVEIEELEVPASGGDLEQLVQQALAMRSELAVLGAQASAKRYEARSLRGAVKPQLAVEGGYLYLESPTIKPNGIGAVMLGVEWTPFDGGVSRAKANALLHRANSIDRIREDTVLAIQAQVRNSWLDEQETRQRIEVTQQAIEQAEENLRATEARFAEGAAINTEVLDAESLRIRTYGNYYDAVYDAAMASFRLRRATGSL